MKRTIMLGIVLGALTNIGSGFAAAPAAPQTAVIDRFSDASGHLFRRSAMSMLPMAGEAIDFDQGPFITKGLGPDGALVSYYNFDVMPVAPAPIYVLFAEGSDMPVAGQFNIVNVIPGDAGYSDFWNVVKVTVPSSYVANQITSLDGLMKAGFKMENTNILVNCPIVPEGSTAKVRYNGNADTGLHEGWYKDMRVSYFHFAERALTLNTRGNVPLSPIFVTFNKNPDSKDPSSGPASGFVADATGQTHNVVASVPEDARYSPLWSVSIYDNQAFASVKDLDSAANAPTLATGAATVNCPIVTRTPR